jgi:hypothetical protein
MSNHIRGKLRFLGTLTLSLIGRKPSSVVVGVEIERSPRVGNAGCDKPSVRHEELMDDYRKVMVTRKRVKPQAPR